MSSSKTAFYLSILDLLAGDNGVRTLADVASRLGVSKQKVNYYAKDLRKAGVLVKRGALWFVDVDARLKFFSDSRSRKVVVSSSGSGDFAVDTVRGHAYQFVLDLPFELSVVDMKRFLKRLRVDWLDKGNGSVFRPGFVFGDWTVHVCRSSVICWFTKDKSFFSESQSALDCWFEAKTLWFRDVVFPFEKVFGRRLVINKDYRFRTSKQHYALIKNGFAKDQNERGGIQVRDDTGVLWALVDKSHFSEFETVNSSTSVDDTGLVVDFFNSVRDTKLSMVDVDKNMKDTKSILHDLALSQKRTQDQLIESHSQLDYYAKNLESHVKSVQQLGVGVEALTKKIGEFGMVKKEESLLDGLKKRIVVQDDVFKFKEEISGLSQGDKLLLTDWLFSKFGSLSKKP